MSYSLFGPIKVQRPVWIRSGPGNGNHTIQLTTIDQFTTLYLYPGTTYERLNVGWGRRWLWALLMLFTAPCHGQSVCPGFFTLAGLMVESSQNRREYSRIIPFGCFCCRQCNQKLQCILTHWGRVTHIPVGKLTIISTDNGLSPERRQAIIWTNAGILFNRRLGTNFSEILIENQTFSFKKCTWKCRLLNGGHLVSALMC